MALNGVEKVQAGIGCFALALWATWIGVVITVVVLVIRALLKYVGS